MTTEDMITLCSIINNTFDGHIASAIVKDDVLTIAIYGKRVSIDRDCNVQIPQQRYFGTTCGCAHEKV